MCTCSSFALLPFDPGCSSSPYSVVFRRFGTEVDARAEANRSAPKLTLAPNSESFANPYPSVLTLCVLAPAPVFALIALARQPLRSSDRTRGARAVNEEDALTGDKLRLWLHEDKCCYSGWYWCRRPSSRRGSGSYASNSRSAHSYSPLSVCSWSLLYPSHLCLKSHAAHHLLSSSTSQAS